MPRHRLMRPDARASSEDASSEDAREVVHAQAVRNRSAHGRARVMSYNVFLRPELITDAETRGENDFKDARLEALIERLDAYDILLLQETWIVNAARRKERLVEAARARGFPYYVRSACDRGGLLSDAMLLILSRHPLVLTREHTFADRVGLERWASKGVLHARAWLNGDASCAVDLFTTHMQAGEANNGGDDVRSRQTRELVQFVLSGDHGADHEVAAVIAGDFNIDGRSSRTDGTPSALYGRLLEDLAPLNDSGRVLQNVLHHGTSNDNGQLLLPVTSPEGLSGREGGGGGSVLISANHSAGKALDYAFMLSRSRRADRAVRQEAGSARVDPMLAGERGGEFEALSDHFALVFTIECN